MCFVSGVSLNASMTLALEADSLSLIEWFLLRRDCVAGVGKKDRRERSFLSALKSNF